MSERHPEPQRQSSDRHGDDPPLRSGDTSGGDAASDNSLLKRSHHAWIFKVIVSGAIAYHLLAVFLPPLSFQTSSLSGPSPIIATLSRPFVGYGQFLHLDRGYAFFAPDPGPSHLIEVAVIAQDGTIDESMYPDRSVQWPRLLYHRHFMLTEFLSSIYHPPGPPDELFRDDPDTAAFWRQARGRYEWVRQSMVDHLRHKNEGKEVAIRRIEHGLPALTEFAIEPIALDDERMYQVLLDQPIFSDGIAPAPPTEEIPAPETAAPPETIPNAGPQGEIMPAPAAQSESRVNEASSASAVPSIAEESGQ